MNNDFLSALGLCRKAGFAIFGFETVKAAMQKGNVFLVFSANDISEKTEKELTFFCENTETECIKTAYDKDTLGGSIGKMTGIIGVTDEGFAAMLKKKLRNQEGIK